MDLEGRTGFISYAQPGAEQLLLVYFNLYERPS
jgi:hypothetical protein